MTIVVGLGNFGDKYAYTYHNLGYLAVEAVADKLRIKFKKRACDSLLGVGYSHGEEIILAKPLTYMNLSGNAVYQLMRKYKATPQDFVILYDDIDLERGTIRQREEGSAGTHNGMRNIIEVTGMQNFPRIRLGIGPRPEQIDLESYVLAEIPPKDRPLYAKAIEETADAVIARLKR